MQPWLRYLKLKMSQLLQLWILCLKVEMEPNFGKFQEFLTDRKITVYYDLETLSYWSPQVWSFLPENINKLITQNF